MQSITNAQFNKMTISKYMYKPTNCTRDGSNGINIQDGQLEAGRCVSIQWLTICRLAEEGS